MRNSLLWRGLLILGVVAAAVALAYPPQEKIRLGLDLRGGIHLVLEVVTEDALRAETDKDMEILSEELKDAGVAIGAPVRSGDNEFGVPVPQNVEAAAASQEVDDKVADEKVADEKVADEKVADEKVADIAKRFLPGWEWSRNGEQVVFKRRTEQVAAIREQAIQGILDTIQERVDAFGVAEPVIHRQGMGSNRIVIQLPGVDDPERIKRLIMNQAFLEFRLVDYPEAGRVVDSREEILSHYGGVLSDTVEIMEQDHRDDLGKVVATSYYALRKAQVITGRDLRDAGPDLGEFNQPVVRFSLKADGAERFARATGENIGRGLAIVLDGRVQTAPRINARIHDSGIIEGTYTQQEVSDLVTVLKIGALPAGINYLEERTVGPSLGQDSIRQGQQAGLLGTGLVVLTMLVVYKGSGINAVVALVLNVVLIFGALAYFGATLTLPGIAGIILTIGMAVDANVLVFERIREELRAGRTVKSAVQAGFAKAFSSIFDANVTTLIAALFLFNFGSGPVKGFAVTLWVGILASVFTAVFCSRWLFDLLLSRRDRVERLSI